MNHLKKLLSVLLVLSMVLAYVPMPALAAEGESCTLTESCTGTYDAGGTCTVCGLSEVPVHTHVYDGAPAYVQKDEAVHTVTRACTTCEEKPTETVDEAHTYVDGACACGKEAPHTHTGGSATCEAAAVCDGCGESYGEPAGHNYVDLVCTVCGADQPCICDTGCKDIATTNRECPVCTEDFVLCAHYVPSCLCAEQCTEENVNTYCVICEADYTQCGGEDKAVNYTSGTTGDCNWSFDESTGTLTISGNGSMGNFPGSSNVPWAGYRSAITSVVFDGSITNIADYAFSSCRQLTGITIPSTVQEIGTNAFAQSGLTSVVIPEGVKTIGQYAFFECYLTSVTIAASVTEIVRWAFQNNSTLTTVTFQGSTAPAIGLEVFTKTDGAQITVNIPAGATGYEYALQNQGDIIINKKYTVTVSSPAEGGTVTADKQTASEGETVTLTVTPNADYKIKSVSYQGENDAEATTITPADGAYTFTMPGKNVTVSAEFESATFTLTVLEAKYGSNQPNPVTLPGIKGETLVGEIKEQLVQLLGGTYHLQDMYLFNMNGTSLTTMDDNKRISEYPLEGNTITMVMCHKVTINAENCKVNSNMFLGISDTEYIVPYGAGKIGFAVTPDEGCQVISVTIVDSDGQPVDFSEENGEYTFTMPASNVEIKAVFEEKTPVTQTEAKWGTSADSLTESGTLAQAIAAAVSGQAKYIQLQKDVQLTDELAVSNGQTTIDLNNKTIGRDDYYAFAFSGGTHSITNGTIEGSIHAYGDSKVTLYADINAANQYAVMVDGGGTLTVAGGTVKSTTRDKGVALAAAVNGTLKITGGTVTGKHIGLQGNGNATITVDGGQISGGNAGIYTEDNSNITVSNGAVSATDAGGKTLWMNGGTLNVTGGTFSGATSVRLVSGSVKLSGGTFSGGILVDKTTLNTILAEDYNYYQNNQVCEINANDTAITGGDVTVAPAPVIPVTSVTLSKSHLDLVVPKTQKLTATVTPANATNQALEWVSSNPDVATVDGSGLVTAVAPGEATITVKAQDDNNIAASCTVKVVTEYPVWVAGIRVTSDNMNDVLGDVDEGATVTYDPQTLTLTLNNADFTYNPENPQAAILTTYEEYTLTVTGSGTINAQKGSGIYSYGASIALSGGPFHISGSSNGIFAEGSGTVKINGAQVTVNAGTGKLVYPTAVINETGTLKLPAGSAKSNISGGTLYIGDKGYQWDETDKKYYCLDQHDWVYTATDKDTTPGAESISIHCGSCGFDSGYLSIEADDAIYDGTSHGARLNPDGLEPGGAGAPSLDAIRYQTQDKYVESPVNAGAYKASITMGDATAYVEYTISPKPLTAKDITITLNKAVITDPKVLPKITVKDGDTILENGKDYLIVTTGAPASGFGECEVQVHGIGGMSEDGLGGNYSDYVSKTYLLLANPDKVEPDNKDAIDAYDRYSGEDYAEKYGDELTKVLKVLHEALTDYEITKGHKSSYVKGSYKKFSFTANGYCEEEFNENAKAYGKFTGVEIDGKLLDPKYYDIKSGSTIITLKTSYLESLKSGKHYIQLNYTDGDTGGKDYFRVTVNNGSPMTADLNHTMLFAAVAAASLLCLAALPLLSMRKKGKYQR